MPKRASVLSVADQDAAPGGAIAVDRALSLLAAFRAGEGAVSLAQLAERTQLYKSTALRLLASLEHARFVCRHPDGRYSLGPQVARLNAVYAASFSLEAAVLPALRRLSQQTRESAAFHVRQGDNRLCLYRVDSPQAVRDHTRQGDLLPLNRGAGGRVIMAFTGARGKIYEEIRHDCIVILSGDRTPQLAGISAPVFTATGDLAGAVTLTMPSERLSRRHAPHVMSAARAITAELGGEFPQAKG